ncbi:MAG TPA: pseudouridine synthase [Acidobacteriota bacterium]|nr:pseudouridine synthase [Acidobacteriota bacterium]HRV08715.1 pseudouridine synthase [Acidobacteriota bacterium]
MLEWLEVVMEERLQKIIACAGLTSRRKAEELIAAGRVTVNGSVVTQLGAKADAERDHIKVDGNLLQAEPKVYYALNKPQGVLSTTSDPLGRPVVLDFVPRSERLFPVGRLDFQSEGLVLLTNDGKLARAVMEAGRLSKVYRVKVQGRPSEEVLVRLQRGIRLRGEQLAAERIVRLKSADNTWLEVILRQGRNRQIRRMFEAVGHPVMRLRRVAVGPVQLGDLKPGRWRKLSPWELKELRKALGGGDRNRPERRSA